MACQDNYITISADIQTSRSGLYASDLPGISTELLDGIARAVSDDHDDIWATIYKRSWRNLVSDISKNIQDKFYMDLKLVSRETSQFKTSANTSSALAGIKLEFWLPKYARVHILSVEVFSNSSYAAGDVIKIYDTDENGELLKTVNSVISAGRNTINIDSDFQADKLFISYNPATYNFRQTENKYYANHYTHYDTVVCDQCFYGDNSFRGLITQVNNGGLNIKYLVICSIERFVCENIKLFEDAFLYKIGHEITVERRLGERLNQFTVMTKERWDELEGFYKAQYEMNVMNAVRNQNMNEDDICFACKDTVRTDTLLP